MIDLEQYKPIIDTTTLSDDEIELWFGSKNLIKYIRLFENCEISYMEFNNTGYIKYNINNESFANYNINLEILSIYDDDLTLLGYEGLTNLLKKLFNFNIKNSYITWSPIYQQKIK